RQGFQHRFDPARVGAEIVNVLGRGLRSEILDQLPQLLQRLHHLLPVQHENTLAAWIVFRRKLFQPLWACATFLPETRNTATSAIRFGRVVTWREPATKISRSSFQPSCSARDSKSITVRK